MKKFLLSTALLLGLAGPALAQGPCAGGGVLGMLVGGTPPNCQYLNIAPTALAGTQTSVSLASATALTIPTGATLAIITVEGTNNTSGFCARWRDDGTAPTASAGTPLASGQALLYNVATLPIKLITATSATCSMDVSYYK